MDVTLARTFVEIVDAGTFMHAAERLHITQTAVSARIRTLENTLGRQLFVRNKSGASLTAAGERFLRHARTLVQVWEHARHQVAVPPGRRAVVTVGCDLSLWDPLLIDWLLWMRRAAPQLAVRTRVSPPANLLDDVLAGVIDIAVVYAPKQQPGLKVELLMEEKLVLVTTSRGKSRRPSGYVFVDWGPDFQADHAAAYPELANTGVNLDLGSMGIDYLLANEASGYFPRRLVKHHVARRRLRIPARSRSFTSAVYMVYPESRDEEAFEPILQGLRRAARRLL